MSINIHAKVNVARPLAEILRRAEAYVAAVSPPPFVILTPGLSASELHIGPFTVPVHVRDGRLYKNPWSVWDRGGIDIGAGPVSQVGLEMVYAARYDEIDLESAIIESLHSSEDDEAGYLAVLRVQRTRGSFCLSLLLAAAIADLNGGRVQDDSNLLELGEWVDPAAIVSPFQRHRGVRSFEELIDVVFEELGIASQWQSAQSMLAELERPSD